MASTTGLSDAASASSSSTDASQEEQGKVQVQVKDPEVQKKLDSLFGMFSAFKKEKELAKLAQEANLPKLIAQSSVGGGTEQERKEALLILRKLSRNEESRQKLLFEHAIIPHLVSLLATVPAVEGYKESTIDTLVLGIFGIYSDTELWLEEMAEWGSIPPLLKFVRFGRRSRARKAAVQALGDFAESYFTRYLINEELEKSFPDQLQIFTDLIYNDPFDSDEKEAWAEILRNCELVRDMYKEGKPWHDAHDGSFPFVKLLEDNWEVIRDEAKQMQEELMVPWPERNLCERGWDVLAFFAFENKIDAPCVSCPKTTKILEQIPGLQTAIFSRLKPRSHIKPHVGYYSYSEKILRVHMGLMVPEGCTLKVNGVDGHWDEGKVFVFDDTFRHEAWNPSKTEDRIVLMFDIHDERTPELRNPEFMATSARQKEVLGEDALVSNDLISALDSLGAGSQNFHERPKQYL